MPGRLSFCSLRLLVHDVFHVAESDDGLEAIVVLDVVIASRNLGDFKGTDGNISLSVGGPSVRQVAEDFNAFNKERMVALQQEVSTAIEEIAGSMFKEPADCLRRNGEGAVAVVVDDLRYSVHIVSFKAVASVKSASRPMVYMESFRAVFRRFLAIRRITKANVARVPVPAVICKA